MKDQQQPQLQLQPQLESQNVQHQLPATQIKQNNKLIYLISVLFLLVLTSLVYFLLLITHTPTKASTTLRILDRSEWKGEPPSGPRAHLATPVPNVMICHTATEGCETEDVCIYRTRVIQNFHMQSLGFYDIGYNFLVGGDGQVYVGRGWHIQGQHVKGYGAVSVGIAFIGTFTKEAPSARQVEASKQLMEEGVRLHKLHADYRIYAHRQLSPTESPGLKLYELMQQWPRWTEDVGPLRRLNNETLKFVPRDYWLAQPAQQPLKSLELPSQRVQFISTKSEPCVTQASCTFRVRLLQTFHIEADNVPDINYNFVIGGDSNVYVGRGWQYGTDAVGKTKEFDGLVVGFVGQGQGSPEQMEIARALLAQGVRLGQLAENYELKNNLETTP
ncbi:peptidoglycan-recognition protein LF [Scaptodrosophila lebanonensis]|uniref:Peptidoglycan-recognition protein LF n=1 Tax=Drosophila lebanonensis TaxID=7225 RepID=A0A6J2TBL8_DROLE|nr:peptidoglycan-recognition protein LF [Scaptodrosophila lebanonensis]